MRRLLRELATLAVFAVICAAAFAAGDLLIYGHVKW